MHHCTLVLLLFLVFSVQPILLIFLSCAVLFAAAMFFVFILLVFTVLQMKHCWLSSIHNIKAMHFMRRQQLARALSVYCIMPAKSSTTYTYVYLSLNWVFSAVFWQLIYCRIHNVLFKFSLRFLPFAFCLCLSYDNYHDMQTNSLKFLQFACFLCLLNLSTS